MPPCGQTGIAQSLVQSTTLSLTVNSLFPLKKNLIFSHFNMFTFYHIPLKNNFCTLSDNWATKNNTSYIAQCVTLIISFQLPGLSFAESERVRHLRCRTKIQCPWECPGALYKRLAASSGNTTCFAGVLYYRRCTCPTFLQYILDLRGKNINSDFQLQSNVSLLPSFSSQNINSALLWEHVQHCIA